MTEEFPQSTPPEELPLLQAPERMTLIDRYNFSPFLFAIVSLGVVLVLYQVVGGLIIAFTFGIKPTATNVMGLRLATGFGQILFIFVPTLLLVRFASLTPGKFFRLDFPDWRLAGLALVGIFSLQQILEILMMFQDKIPVPDAIEKFLEPIKQLFEELTRMLVSSGTVPEFLLVTFIIAFIPAIAEEFLFRGLVMRCFQRSIGPGWAVALTGIIFGMYHLNPFEIVPLVLLGIYLSFLAMRGDSIWISVLAHFFNNAAACYAVYLHLDEDAIVTGNPNTMPLPGLIFTFVVCGLIFGLSTYFFVLLTKKAPPEFPEPKLGAPVI